MNAPILSNIDEYCQGPNKIINFKVDYLKPGRDLELTIFFKIESRSHFFLASVLSIITKKIYRMRQTIS